jgi:hypothetical protein
MPYQYQHLNKGCPMRHHPHFLAALVPVVAMVVLLTCEKTPITPDTLPDGATQNGYYIVMTPYAGSTIKGDTTVAITWNSTVRVTDSNVRICLYREDTLVQVIVSSTANDGSYSYRFALIDPGDKYHIKIASVSDTANYDFGGFFEVKNRYFGTITITSPVDTTLARVGTSIPVRWTTTDSIGATIYVQLYKDTTGLNSYSASTSQNLYSYPLSSSLIAGSDYRFKAWSYYNSSIYDYSDYFTITSKYSGSIEVTSPTDTTETLLGSSVVVRWAASADSVGTTVSIVLYNDTSMVGTTRSASTSSGSYTYSLPTSLVPGSKYRFKVSSYYDENIYGYSPYFTVTSQYNGGYTITSPDSGATWAAGSSYSIEWTTTGSPGSSVRITLYKGGDSVLLVRSSYSSSGPYQWSIPSGMITSKDYQIRISSYYDPTIYAMSGPFTISGILEDQYENDNSRAGASTITLGTVQNHTLTTNDTDFVAMNLDSGSLYLIRNTGTAYSYNYIYSSTDSVSSLTSFSNTGSTSSGSLRWTCPRTGKYFIRITQYSISYLGAYSLLVTKFDSLSAVHFITPDSTTTWASGSSYSVTWTPDTALFGTSVYLYLWDESQRILWSSSSGSNSGTRSFTIPSGLATGKIYRMKMVNYSSSSIYGYSQLFTISGITPDGFEPDNNRAHASTLVLGSPQSHTLSRNDTDFVAMNLDSGKIYLFSNTGTAYSYNYIYRSTDSLSYLTSFSHTSSSASGSLRWVCPQSGKYFVQIRQYSTSYLGDYSFLVTQFDSLAAARFTSPDSNTVWAAGSSYPVTWTPDTGMFGTTVYLYLWDDSRGVNISSISSSNGGSCTFSIPSGLATGKIYRMKMVNYTSSTICAYSKLFTITGITPDGFEPDNKRADASTLVLGSPQSHTLTLADTDFVAMNLEGGKTYFFSNTGTAYSYNYIYRSTDSLSYLTYFYRTSSSTSGSLRWVCPSTGKYLVLIRQYSTSYLGAYSFNVMEFDSIGTARFITPDSTTTWAAGSAYSVTWTPDSAFFGTTVYLYLWDEKRRTLITSTSSTNGGACSFTVPAGLESGKFYRMKMVNYSTSANYGYSQLFYISGVAPDAYEPDDSASMAKTIPTDSTVQVRSLSRYDIDWVTFNAIASRLYVIDIPCSTSTTLRFFASSSNLVTPTQTASGSLSSDARISWFSSAAGTPYFSVQGASSSYTGSYRAWVKAYDSSAYRFTVSSPAAGASVQIGSILAIAWSAKVSLGGAVDIFLYDNANTPQTIVANSSNSGSYSWTVPATVAGGTGYYVKVILHNSSDVFGMSGAFSIVP